MKPQYIIKTLLDSIAYELKQYFPGVKVYVNPSQQKAQRPCFFIELIPLNDVRQEVDNRYLHQYNIDLVLLYDFNEVDLYDKYLAAAENLNSNLKFIRYGEDEDQLIRCIDRNFTVDMSALHYKFTVKVRTSYLLPDQPKILEVDISEHVIEPEVVR